jgi:hypothetical protein
MNDLVKFWRSAKLSGEIIKHPSDVIASNRIHPSILDYKGYTEAFKNDELDEHLFHLSLIPKPYSGDLDNADIFILLLNPGLHAADFKLEFENKEYRDALVSVIEQDCTKHLNLDPTWAWTSGFSWWEGKFRPLVQSFIRDDPSRTYFDTLTEITKRIAWIELVPYHSKSFRGGCNLASSNAAKKFVHELVDQEDRLVIVTRKVTDWGFGGADETDNLVLYNSGEARGASLGPNSRGGQRIRQRLTGNK